MLRKILPHAAIIMSLMYLVFFFIDRVNTAMAFINNDMTKVLLLILCVISVVNAVLLIADDRKRTRDAQRRRQMQQRAATPQRAPQRPQPRPMPRSEYDRRDYEPRRYR